MLNYFIHLISFKHFGSSKCSHFHIQSHDTCRQHKVGNWIWTCEHVEDPKYLKLVRYFCFYSALTKTSFGFCSFCSCYQRGRGWGGNSFRFFLTRGRRGLAFFFFFSDKGIRHILNCLTMSESNIRHKNLHAPPWRHCCPNPWILKRGGLEISGQRVISSNGKTKKKTIFSSSFSLWKKYVILHIMI